MNNSELEQDFNAEFLAAFEQLSDLLYDTADTSKPFELGSIDENNALITFLKIFGQAKKGINFLSSKEYGEYADTINFEALQITTLRKVKSYMEEFDFDADSGMDPVKVFYFLIETLYERGVVKDMNYLKLYISSYFSIDKFKLEDFDAQFLKKGLFPAKKSYELLTDGYGKYGLYSIFKLTYWIYKKKFADEYLATP